MRHWLGLIIVAAALAAGPPASALELAGEVVQGGLVRGQAAPGSEVRLGDRRLRLDDQGRFLFGIGRDERGPLRLQLRRPDGRREIRELAVRQRRFAVQRIEGLPPRQVEPLPADLVKIKADQAKLNAARRLDSAEDGFASAPVWPALGPISGVFGSQRILNGKPRAPHRGLDVAAPSGTPVGAMAPGVVVVAVPDMYFTGGTVVIDHGHGLSSLYAHMSELRTEVGQRVTAGQMIGRVGATGRATGPHLHWGVFWFDQGLDPALLMGPMPDPLPARQPAVAAQGRR